MLQTQTPKLSFLPFTQKPEETLISSLVKLPLFWPGNFIACTAQHKMYLERPRLEAEDFSSAKDNLQKNYPEFAINRCGRNFVIWDQALGQFPPAALWFPIDIRLSSGPLVSTTKASLIQLAGTLVQVYHKNLILFLGREDLNTIVEIELAADEKFGSFLHKIMQEFAWLDVQFDYDSLTLKRVSHAQ